MTIKQNLEKLTKGLLYIGESEFPFEVFDWGICDENNIKLKIQSGCQNSGTSVNIEAQQFFQNYINRLIMSGDDVMMADVAKYKTLQNFVLSNFTSTNVYRCGANKIAIYIICKTTTNAVFVLKTYTIET